MLTNTISTPPGPHCGITFSSRADGGRHGAVHGRPLGLLAEQQATGWVAAAQPRQPADAADEHGAAGWRRVLLRLGAARWVQTAAASCVSFLFLQYLLHFGVTLYGVLRSLCALRRRRTAGPRSGRRSERSTPRQQRRGSSCRTERLSGTTDSVDTLCVEYCTWCNECSIVLWEKESAVYVAID